MSQNTDPFPTPRGALSPEGVSARVPEPYVPTPDDLDDLMVAISRSAYASEAVEVVEEWTRAKWGVESAFTTKDRARREAERIAALPVFGQPESSR